MKQLNDPQLDSLIQRTLSGSHPLAEAKLREEKAQSQADLLDAGSQLQVAALGCSTANASRRTAF